MVYKMWFNDFTGTLGDGTCSLAPGGWVVIVIKWRGYEWFC